MEESEKYGCYNREIKDSYFVPNRYYNIQVTDNIMYRQSECKRIPFVLSKECHHIVEFPLDPKCTGCKEVPSTKEIVNE